MRKLVIHFRMLDLEQLEVFPSKESMLINSDGDQINELRKFILEHPNVRNPITDTLFLKRFLYFKKFDLEEAKKTLVAYYKLRHDFPIRLDIDDQEVCGPLLKGFAFPLTSCDSLGRLVVMGIRSSVKDVNSNLMEKIQLSTMVLEYLTCTSEEAQKNGIVFILHNDGNDGPPLVQAKPGDMLQARKNMKATMKNYPLKWAGTLLLNTPSWLVKVWNLIPFVPAKIRARIKFFKEPEELVEHVGKSILPQEYGGEAGPVADMINEFVEKMKSSRDFFLALNNATYVE